MVGILYVVVMLIGNLGDIIFCVVYVLGFVDVVVCEDMCVIVGLLWYLGLYKLFVVLY